MSTIKWTLQRSGAGWTGTVVLPGGPCAVATSAKGATKADALSKAASLANELASNPVLSAILPPGTSAAIKATSALAKAAKVGKLASVASKYAGGGIKRLSKILSW